MDRKSGAPVAVILLALVVGACVGSGPAAPTTSEAPTSATSPPPTTTLTVDLVITVVGSQVVWSQDGVVYVSGWVDRPAELTVAGVAAATHTDTSGRTGFDVEVVLEPGEHEIPVVARHSSGVRTTELLTVIVDHDLEVELAYVQSIDPEARTLAADYVQFLTGDEAVAAAREDGYIGADEDLPGDFYIRNLNPRLRTLRLSASPVVVLNACYPDDGPCVTREAVDFDTWRRLWADPGKAMERVGWYWYGSAQLPYWLTLKDGVVVQVDEQYLP